VVTADEDAGTQAQPKSHRALIGASRRFTSSLATLFISSFVIFGAMYLAPGSPLDFLLGGTQVAPGEVEALKQQYGLNHPFAERYFNWLGQLFQGNLGTSITFHTPVWQLLTARFETTGLLICYAVVLTVVLGCIWGAIGALRGGQTDTSIVAGTSILLATPPFVAAVLLVDVFAVRLHWFPVQGGGSSLPDRLWHLTLPALALALALGAFLARVVRTSLRDELGKEHVVTAVSRGLPYPSIVRRHVARNALMPIVTLVGLIVAYLVTGTIVVENVFALNGLGSLLVSSVGTHDFPVVQAIALLVVLIFVVVNVLVDLTYVLIDPRLRAQ
jgi:peptide/nickel transport system permease protein